MSRRSTLLLPQSRDGTSQRSRRLDALDPAYAPIDERTTADLLRFVQGRADPDADLGYAGKLRLFQSDGDTGGTWAGFAGTNDDIPDILAYLADPARFTGARARWLGRPHFALLLTFVELLGHARDQLNGFTRRHLDYYYRDVLQIRPEAPVPDRATVIFGLRPGATEVQLPAGTELQAGRDAGGVPRIYRTEREIVVNRAVVAQLRSVFVDRRITGIADVRADRSLTAADALTRTLKIALGSPRPGDPVPPWPPSPPGPPSPLVPVDFAFLKGRRDLLDFARTSLQLEHDELRSLMRLVRRRRAADAEWAEINRLLGVTNPVKPRDFLANLTARAGVLDFAADGLPQVNSVDDLYTFRTEPDVRKYIDGTPGPDDDRTKVGRLAVIGFDNFVALMRIKVRIDAEWAEVNRLLERSGRRQRGVLAWSFPSDPPGSFDPTNFDANLALALQWPKPPLPSPPPWPSGTHGIDDYEALLRRLEVHLSMPIDRVETLVSFAQQIAGDTKSEAYDWSDVDRILADAYREKLRAARQAQLVAVRAGKQDLAAFDAVASFVVSEPPRPGETATPLTWEEASKRLATHLDRFQLDLLARFRDGLVTHHPIFGFDWSDADRLFELAWRHVEGLPEPIAQKIEVHNVYAYDDATQVKDGPAAPGWKTFGKPPVDPDENQPRGATLGWALRSPLLSLSEGQRTVTLTLGLCGDGFKPADQANFLAALGLGATVAAVTSSSARSRPRSPSR